MNPQWLLTKGLSTRGASNQNNSRQPALGAACSQARAVRSSLLPAGEGGRYGRMRVTAPAWATSSGGVEVEAGAPHPPLREHLLPGGEGEDAPPRRRRNGVRDFDVPPRQAATGAAAWSVSIASAVRSIGRGSSANRGATRGKIGHLRVIDQFSEGGERPRGRGSDRGGVSEATPRRRIRAALSYWS